MNDQYNSGIDMPYPAASGGAIVEDAFGVLVNYRPNRYPLTDKLDKRPLRLALIFAGDGLLSGPGSTW